MPSWDDFEDEPVDPIEATDLEMVLMTRAQDIMDLPLGCRLEFLTADNVRVSIGMLERATFTKDDWSIMIWCVMKAAATPQRMVEWIEKKRESRGAWRACFDRVFEAGVVEDADRRFRRVYGPTVGDVLQRFGLTLQKVATEL